MVEILEDRAGDKVAHRGASRGNVRFHWPDRRPFPDVPPAPKLPDDPLAALEAEHSGLEIHVDPDTTTPLWNGERFDVGYAIHTMWRPRAGTPAEGTPASWRSGEKAEP